MAAWLRPLAVLTIVFVAGTALLLGSSRANRDDERRIALFNIHNKETIDIVYKRGGKLLPEAIARLDWFLRDWRRNEQTKMDPALYDIIWELRTELGTREPTHVISGYRSPGTNEKLRKTVGGQAKNSQHTRGKAMDVHFPDVPVKRLRYSALVRERGGVGYYPTSAIPFVHVDTGRVRHWPKMPRLELALLFPTGKSQHIPADGRPLSIRDVETARAEHADLAQQVAAFHQFRRAPQPPRPVLVAERAWNTAVIASAEPPPRAAVPPPVPNPAGAAPVRLASLGPITPPSPRLAERPSRLRTGPSSEERSRLTDLFTLATLFPAGAHEPVAPPSESGVAGAPGEASPPGMTGHAGPSLPAVAVAREDSAVDPRPADREGWGNGFVAAPEYDDEHPDELFYRPFPLAPLLTASASPDDPALARLWEPDVAATLELLDDDLVALPMRFSPTGKAAARLWAQQFSGKAVQLGTDAMPTAGPAGLENRRVKTSLR
ncbi:MAG: DUF882 domain-containing protein [Hyphomicrobiaceae bacterium]|nr:DUF882 domain-containing protein [Hyphomicrobiaceae bacterium]